MIKDNDKKALLIRNAFLSLTSIFIVLEIVIIFQLNQPVKIVVEDMSTEEELFVQEVEYGERFAVNYIHSVERSPVSEVFEVRADGIYTMESHTESFGAGMPYEGEDIELQDGKFIIKNINRKVHGGTLRIRPSSVFPHHIIIGDTDIVISDAPYKGKNLEVKLIKSYFRGD
ncbi:MAG TPA: DUF1850 domain-containing protein [Jeotgalicoccus sp.]|jgi:hypothetical protein|nr:DUF1850 domain-containing protein [Jeotgalicoccus sp.]